MAIEKTIDERPDGSYWLTKFFTVHTGKVSVKVKEGQGAGRDLLIRRRKREGLKAGYGN